MRTSIYTFVLFFLTIKSAAGFVPEITFLIDDNFYDYTIVAERLSTSDPLFGQNFMEVGTSQYNYVTCSEFDFEQLEAPYDFRMGFLYLRNQGVPPDFPFIGEGKLRFSIYRGGFLVFTFKIDLVHLKSQPPSASPDLTFKYTYATGVLIAEAQTTMQVAYDQMIYCWVLHNEQRDINWYVNDVELTNFLATGPEPNIKTIFTTATMGFPDPENFQTGEEYPPGTFAPLWRGVYYGLTVSHTTYTKNNIVYNFRNWFGIENYSSSTTFRILENTSRFRSDFYPVYPFTVSNNLEGGSSNNDFEITWHNPDPDIITNWQYGTGYDAFKYETPNFDIYSVKALTPIQSLGTTWHFRKWNDGSTNNIKSNLQITAPMTLTAYYKGIQRSDDENAYISNSQRKFVRTDDDWLHNVYSSMGRVWYEISSNNGVTWQLANNGQPLDNGEGKLPSIDYALKSTGGLMIYQIAIVFQEKAGGSSSKIKIKYFEKIDDNPSLNFISQKEIATVTGDYSTTSTNPVIGFSHGSVATVIWKNGNTGPLYGWYGSFGSLINTLMGPAQISGTTVNSVNPTIYAKKTGTTLSYKLAWEELGVANTSSIKYATLIGYLTISGAITTPSSGSGFTQNFNPSIIQFMDASRLCWVGSRWVSDPINEEDGFSQTKVLFKAPESTTSRFWQFGNFVSGPNINRKTGDDTYYAFAWYESSGQSKFADNTLSTIRTITDVTGQNLQISNGPNKENMFCMSFDHNAGVPYYFQMSDDLGSFYTMEKITYFAFNSGREGIVSDDSAEFYFAIGDLSVDDQQINFKEIEDSIQISTLSVLNDYLISEPFVVSDNSSFTYSVQYGINDSVFAVNALIGNQHINFIVKLIDDNTGEILSEFDNVTYNSENVYQYSNITYQVNTQGLGNRTVRLKLVVDNNFNLDYSLSKIYSDESVLGKINFKEINIYGNGVISTYELFQNYPNPFNPTTTIKYQLPKDGMVTLKVYDILGAEVATLVNEEKTAGKYEANFNASSLASGVYLYKLQANEYISVKKMVLVR